MLTAHAATFSGRHEQLMPPTSLQVERATLHLLAADTQAARTAAALVLAGRMKPTAGSVAWAGQPTLKALRRHSALLDSPEVSEPEAHLLVRDLVAEDLALVPGPPWRKPRPKKWMAQHGFSDAASQWADALDPERRLELQLLLAAENPQTELLVVDSPDRHGIEAARWLEALEDFCASHREFAVVALVARIPECWTGPGSYLGQAPPPLQASPAPEPEPEPEFVQEELDLGLFPIPAPAAEPGDAKD